MSDITYKEKIITVITTNGQTTLQYEDSFSVLYKEDYNDNDLDNLLDSTDENIIAEQIRIIEENEGV
tara:strand:+ start:32307 stop:32507 length:201 start_codon:yes stop_codon:yes gene_type:complete